jgi:hypothetical protein
MRPQTIGRALGIGLRVAGRIVGQRMSAGASGTTIAPTAQAIAGAEARGRAAGRTTKGVARGLGGFFRPFLRVGGIVGLEVTGTFFFLFVLVFARAMWRVRANYAYGQDHLRFMGYAAMVAVFLYLGVSSFWRARKR